MPLTPVGPLGVATAIGFQPTGGGKAAITGDFVLTGNEVNPVIQALRSQTGPGTRTCRQSLTGRLGVPSIASLARAMGAVTAITSMVSAPALMQVAAPTKRYGDDMALAEVSF
jgi:hypothetical protein